MRTLRPRPRASGAVPDRAVGSPGSGILTLSCQSVSRETHWRCRGCRRNLADAESRVKKQTSEQDSAAAEKQLQQVSPSPAGVPDSQVNVVSARAELAHPVASEYKIRERAECRRRAAQIPQGDSFATFTRPVQRAQHPRHLL